MRLLHTTKRKLEEFQEDEIPPYAILSHTWGKNEITFQDIMGAHAMKKTGYEKVGQTCAIAAAHGFDYVWIDTCCIDKTSSAELSEAINSMYRWYQDSCLCYVYLADVPPNVVDHQTGATGPEFSKSRWFTRGWTLQELIGPEFIIFLDQQWQEIGTKSTLQKDISRITGIPINILCGDDLNSASIAQRMSWASKRKTTRVEDLAYCLMGMFGINMPLLYGEGERAFIRLQEEIMKFFDDYSLFAWKNLEMNRSGLLAPSPVAFSGSSNIISFNPSNSSSEAITVNNKGIHLKLRFQPIDLNFGIAILPCTENGKGIGIYLEAIPKTNEYFDRIRISELEQIDLGDISQSKYVEKGLCVRQEQRIHKKRLGVFLAAKSGLEVAVQLLLKQGAQIEAKNEYGETLLTLAVQNGHEAVVKLLLEQGAELEARDKFGRKPLLLAARNGYNAVVKLLLEQGAELEAKDNYSNTPLSIARMNRHKAVVQLLLEKGAEIQ